jgi:hypothetical protein
MPNNPFLSCTNSELLRVPKGSRLLLGRACTIDALMLWDLTPAAIKHSTATFSLLSSFRWLESLSAEDASWLYSYILNAQWPNPFSAWPHNGKRAMVALWALEATPVVVSNVMAVFLVACSVAANIHISAFEKWSGYSSGIAMSCSPWPDSYRKLIHVWIEWRWLKQHCFTKGSREVTTYDKKFLTTQILVWGVQIESNCYSQFCHA